LCGTGVYMFSVCVYTSIQQYHVPHLYYMCAHTHTHTHTHTHLHNTTTVPGLLYFSAGYHVVCVYYTHSHVY
jgi:hypothetical protein